jgi:hypothetical protein
MLEQAWSIEVVILRAVRYRPTYFSTRKRAIVCVLPTHREWREVPVVTAGNSGAVRIRLLMTTSTIQTRHAFALWSTHNVGDVTPPVIILLRIVCRSVTVDAARMS